MPLLALNVFYAAVTLSAAVSLANTPAATISEELPAGTEGLILERTTEGPNASRFRMLVVQGKHKGKIVWLEEEPLNSSFNFYQTANGLSVQTLDLTEATFVRSKKPVAATIDLSALIGQLDRVNKRPEVDCWEDLVDLSKFYPVPKIKKPMPLHSAQDRNQPCPKRPTRGNGRACPKTNPVSLDQSKLLRQYIAEAAADSNVPPAIVAALIAQESRFDPFAQNQSERARCQDPKNVDTCSEYGWSKGMSQIGSVIAAKYGLSWKEEFPEKTDSCRRSHVSDECIADLTKICDEHFAKYQRYPMYCPKQSVAAMAMYLRDMIKRERPVNVLLRDSKNAPSREVVLDLRYILTASRANLLRYIAGEYNRGPRVDNSIEEFFRQYGKAPIDYWQTWTTRRAPSGTPSKEIGFHLLHGEFINRCYVWNVAGLCGDKTETTSLVHFYERYFK